MTDPIQFGNPVGEFRTRPCAYAVVIDGGELLCVEVRGRFHLPGGGIDAGEDAKAAIVREIFEETGYRGVTGEEIGRANQFYSITTKGDSLNKVATFYRANVDRSGGGVGQEADHIVRWVSTDAFLSSTAADFQKWAVRQAVS
jgi:8-oxo-dGTP diphosphatase